MPEKFSEVFRGYVFRAEFGDVLAGFQEIDGLSSESEVISYPECTNPFRTTSVPGRTSFGNLVLRRGKAENRGDLVRWRNEVVGLQPSFTSTGHDPRLQGWLVPVRTGLIHLFDPSTNKIVVTWKVHKAWPFKLETKGLNAQATGLVIETLELAHEGYEEIRPGSG